MWLRPGFVRFSDIMTSARAKEDDISLTHHRAKAAVDSPKRVPEVRMWWRET